MSYYNNGGFSHLKKGLVNQMATDQALYALVAYKNTLANDPPLFNRKKVRKPAPKKNKTKVKKSTVVKDDQINTETQTKKNKTKKKENKNETTSAPIEETTVQNEKAKEDKASPVWFWIGLAVVFAGGVGFTVYKKVGRKDV